MASDVDIFVIHQQAEAGRFRALGDVRMALRDLPWPRAGFDVFGCTPTEWEARKSDLISLEHAIAKEGVRIYG